MKQKQSLMRLLVAVSLFISFMAVAGPTQAGVPGMLSYQGRIMGADGKPLEYENVTFEFTVTSPDGTCVLYRELRAGFDMRNSGGVFDVPIGSGSKNYPSAASFKLMDSFSNGGAFTCEGGAVYNPVFDDARLLRVQFYDGLGWRLISPDSVVNAVPFAGYASSAAKLGTNTAADFVLKTGIPTCTTGQFLAWNGTAFSCGTVSGGAGGTVTDITVGTGLTGGTITGSGAIGLGSELAAVNALSGTGFVKRTGTATYSTVSGFSLATDVTGTLPIANGGTNSTTALNNNRLMTSSGGAIVELPAMSDGQVVVGKTGAAPQVVTMGTDASIANNGALTIANNAITSAKILDATVAPADLNFAGTQAVNTGLVVRDGTQFYNKSCASGQVLAWDTTSGWICAPMSVTETDPKVGSNTANYLSKWDGSALVASGLYESAGNVGIGTNSPLALGSNINALTISGKASDNSYAGGLVLNSADGSSVLSYLYATTGGLSIYNAKNSALTFATNASEKMRVQADGKVGIGTDAPAAKLQVSGDAIVGSGTLAGYAQTAQFKVLGNAVNPASNVENLGHFNTDQNNNRAALTISNSGSGAWDNNFISFAVHGSAFTGANYLGEVNAGEAILWAQGSNVSKFSIGTASTNNAPLTFFTANTERMYIGNAGNVGIGTNNPTQKLDVAGKVKATELCIGTDCKAAWPAAGGSGTVTDITAGTGLTGGTITASGTIGLGTELAGVNALATTGFVKRTAAGTYSTAASFGVGDLNFAGSQSVNTGIMVRDGTQFYNKSCGGNEALIWTASNGWTCSPVVLSESDPKVGTNTTNYASKWNGSALVASGIFESGGSVGIGTNSPGYMLQVGSTTGTSDGKIAISKIGGGSRIMVLGYDSSFNFGLFDQGSNMQFGINYGAPANSLTINGGGRVGIGTTSANSSLQVGAYNGTSTVASIGGAATGAAVNALSLVNGATPANGSEVALSMHPGAGYSPTAQIRNIVMNTAGPMTDMVLSVYGSGGLVERMRLAGTGNVGIGTDNPTQKLSVAGTIESTSGGVKFPDGTTQTTAATGSAAADIVTTKCGTAAYYNGSTYTYTGCTATPACPTGYASIVALDEMRGAASYSRV